MSEGF
jgi:hypothetical protein